MGLGLLLPEYEDLGPELHCLLKVKADLLSYTPISPRITLVPRVADQYFRLIGRISARQSGTYGITGNHLGRSGKVWRNHLSPTRVGYRKTDRLLFLNMFKNSSRSKSVGRWSSWSSEDPLKVALSRLPSGAFLYPLELSYTLGSFRIPSAALCQGSCEGCHKESIVTKFNNKIWFYIYSKSLFKILYQCQRIINQIYFF